MKPHFPIVRIETPEPPPGGPTPPSVLTRVAVDGRMWPVIGWSVESGVDKWQRVTLTFDADVTITHPAKPPVCSCDRMFGRGATAYCPAHGEVQL